MEKEMAIGELSRRTECGIETIRYYERAGILPPPRRSMARYRLYEPDDVTRLRFVRRARELGFTLDEVRALLLLSGSDGSRAEVRKLAKSHLADVRARIVDLQKMEQVLADAAYRCECDEGPGCPLIETLHQTVVA